MAERAEPTRLAIEEFQRRHGRPPADADEAGIRLPGELTYWTRGKEWALTWPLDSGSGASS
jgi:hypothetical protein